MGGLALEKLHVLITGVEASVSRDAARLLASQGAAVTAADPDARALARLARDVSLYGLTLETAVINLASTTAIRLVEDHLRLVGRLPHVIVCCCGHTGEACSGVVAARVLQPSLFLQLTPARGRLTRALAGLRHPTLLNVLARKPGRGIFDPETSTPYVRIASHLYAMTRSFDEPAPAPTAHRNANRAARTAAGVSDNRTPRADAA
ncbi:MAG TPA: hypothetical protein VG939_12885 [Caulobacteraceae bacterium]|nr:hypothetical protein [Caulobacteraceae bacterium]